MTLALVCAILFLGFIYTFQHDDDNILMGLAAIAAMFMSLGLGWYAWPS